MGLPAPPGPSSLLVGVLTAFVGVTWNWSNFIGHAQSGACVPIPLSEAHAELARDFPDPGRSYPLLLEDLQNRFDGKALTPFECTVVEHYSQLLKMATEEEEERGISSSLDTEIDHERLKAVLRKTITLAVKRQYLRVLAAAIEEADAIGVNDDELAASKEALATGVSEALSKRNETLAAVLSSVKAFRYLPLLAANDTELLQVRKGSTYKVVATPGVHYRFSPDMNDRDELNVAWPDSLVQGALSDGWLKVKDEFKVEAKAGEVSRLKASIQDGEALGLEDAELHSAKVALAHAYGTLSSAANSSNSSPIAVAVRKAWALGLGLESQQFVSPMSVLTAEQHKVVVVLAKAAFCLSILMVVAASVAVVKS